MTGRKAIVILSLLCGLAFCAITAPGVSAEQTAFECEKKDKEKTGFEDPHCDKEAKVEANVKYVHKAIAAGTKTKITLTNEFLKDNTRLPSLPMFDFPVGTEQVNFACWKVDGTGMLTNKAGGLVEGEVKIEFRRCLMPRPQQKACKVKEPVVLSTPLISSKLGVDGLESEKEEKLGEITIEERNKCKVIGTYEVKGNLLLDQFGATYEFIGLPPLLTIGGESALLDGVVTMKKEGTATGIALTTGP